LGAKVVNKIGKSVIFAPKIKEELTVMWKWFRKKDEKERRLTSPDELGGSIRVTSPSVYLVLGTMAVLAIAFIIWIFCGNVTEKVMLEGIVSADHQMLAFVGADHRYQLAKGEEVQAWPAGLPRERNGYISGKVVGVGMQALSREKVMEQCGEQVTAIFPEGDLAYTVEVALDRAEGNPTAYRWAFEQRDRVDIAQGMFCHVMVISKRRSMFAYIFEYVYDQLNQLRLMKE